MKKPIYPKTPAYHAGLTHEGSRRWKTTITLKATAETIPRKKKP